MTNVTGLLFSSSPIQLQNFAKVMRLFPAMPQLHSNADTANYAIIWTTACNSGLVHCGTTWFHVLRMFFTVISFSSIMLLAYC